MKLLITITALIVLSGCSGTINCTFEADEKVVEENTWTNENGYTCKHNGQGANIECVDIHGNFEYEDYTF